MLFPDRTKLKSQNLILTKFDIYQVEYKIEVRKWILNSYSNRANSQGERAMIFTSRLLKDRIIILDQKLMTAANSITSQLLFLEAQDKGEKKIFISLY